MDIYLELRVKSITAEGTTAGLTQEHKKDSIRWKILPLAYPVVHELEGAPYNIYLEGVYEDPRPNINFKTLVVKAEYVPNNLVSTQIGGFVPRETDQGTIYNIPLHITTVMEQDSEEGIDGIGPMEGGIQAQLCINDPATYPNYTEDLNKPLIATAILEHNMVHELYDYIETECRTDVLIYP